jgi:hypothetical protein
LIFSLIPISRRWSRIVVLSSLLVRDAQGRLYPSFGRRNRYMQRLQPRRDGSGWRARLGKRRVSVPHERQGNPGERTVDPGREPILARDRVAPPHSGEEGCVAEWDIPDHSLMVVADGGDTVGSASSTRILAPKRRRKKSPLTVRKGASKRTSAL